jgi:Deacetylase PdaC
MKWALVLAVALIVSGPGQAKPFKSELKTADAEFSYSWSAEVSAVPALAKRFTADMRKQRAATIAGGTEYNAERKKRGEEPLGYMHSTAIETAGQSPRLLSLKIDVGEFTGGAHGNSGSDGLLWDRRLTREIAINDLFIQRNALTNLTRTAYCKALDRERLKRRGGEKIGGQFDDCPRFDELAILPADTKRNGRFDTIRFIASPYVAGPYVEGDYELELPVTRQLIAAIKPAYRPSFEIQRQ